MANVNTNAGHIPPSPVQGEGQRTRPVAFPHCGGPISIALAKILNEEVSNNLRPRTYFDMIAEALVRKALKGNIQAFREIADRIEGKPSEVRRVGPNGPVEFIVSYATPVPGNPNPGIHSAQPQAEHVESA